MELLRFTTAGSVDDGKSTLIGRLLHDSKAVYEDQLASVKKSRINRSVGTDRFFPADGRIARGTRARHHHRCGLPLFCDSTAEIHHRGHAGARAVHAQHGHRRVHGGSCRDSGGCHEGDPSADTAPCVHRFAAGDTQCSRGGEQDGSRRLPGRCVSWVLSGIFCSWQRNSESRTYSVCQSARWREITSSSEASGRFGIRDRRCSNIWRLFRSPRAILSRVCDSRCKW